MSSDELPAVQNKRALLKRLVVIALPMVVSQASETAMMFVDRLFLAQVSQVHLAAAMAGGLTTFTVASLFVGLVGYVNALVAQYHGAGKPEYCARATAQAVFVSFLAVPLLVVVAIVIPGFFQVMGHAPAQVPLETTYARWLISGAVLLLLRNALTGFFLGIGRTRVVMVSNIAAMVVNIPLNYVLIFGAFGIPPLGIVGAAIGTLGGGATALAILVIGYFSRRTNDQYHTRGSLRLELPILKRLLRFGSPAGVEIFLNTFAFNLFVQLMHGYGSTVAAATTITFNWDIVSFVPMLGLGIATTAVVGQYVGADDVEGARASTLLALTLGLAYSGSMMLLFVFGASPLVGLFAGNFDTAAEVSALARTMLRLAGIYVMADSAQLVFAGALRGAGDTRWVMWASAALHWVFAIVAIILIRVVEASPIVVWIAFIAFVVSIGTTMYLRFRAGKWRDMRVI